jgi:transcriptional regulator of acetoin/glycerol metabolism
MLRKYHWNKGQTASALSINRTTLWRKMKKYNISF